MVILSWIVAANYCTARLDMLQKLTQCFYFHFTSARSTHARAYPGLVNLCRRSVQWRQSMPTPLHVLEGIPYLRRGLLGNNGGLIWCYGLELSVC